MPRFFDDYSNTYLTHDSSAGRKQQRRGWKFRENFRLHYQPHIDGWRRGKMGLAAAQQSFIKARGVTDSAVPPLPEGWKEELDEVTGISYYIDTVSRTRTWVRPGFIPPPPGGMMPQRGSLPPGSFQHRGPPQPYHQNNRGAPPLPHQTYGGVGGLNPPPIPLSTNSVPPPPGGNAVYGNALLPPPPQTAPPQFYLPPPGQAMPIMTNPVGPPQPGGPPPLPLNLPPPLPLNLPPPPGAPQV
jgi:U1 small nuclear ribonucleoprotein C